MRRYLTQFIDSPSVVIFFRTEREGVCGYGHLILWNKGETRGGLHRRAGDLMTSNPSASQTALLVGQKSTPDKTLTLTKIVAVSQILAEASCSVKKLGNPSSNFGKQSGCAGPPH